MQGWLVAAAVVLSGCSDDPPACTTVETDCAPLYAPTWDNVYAQTIATSCGGARSSCHSATGDGGMNLSTKDLAYGSLLAGRIEPGDPGCSEAVVRIHGVGEPYLMPPGAPLSESARCAIAQWVEAGALEVTP